MIIFPEPQIVELTGGRLALGRGGQVIAGDNPTGIELHAASIVENATRAGDGVRIVLGTPETNPLIPTSLLERLEGVPNPDQGYVIRVSQHEIVLAGKTPIGVLYAAQTFAQDKNSKQGNPQRSDIV